jgi:hypothetical protein
MYRIFSGRCLPQKIALSITADSTVQKKKEMMTIGLCLFSSFVSIYLGIPPPQQQWLLLLLLMMWPQKTTCPTLSVFERLSHLWQ